MARILSHVDDAALSAIVDQADLFDPLARNELERILRGRRDKILRRYLLRLSSLARPEVQEGRRLCVEDRAEAAGLGAAPAPAARLWLSRGSVAVVPVSRGGTAELCLLVPEIGEGQRVLDVSTGRPGQLPLRIHLLEGAPLRVVGLERPQDDQAPPG
jgi:hypothetical protein